MAYTYTLWDLSVHPAMQFVLELGRPRATGLATAALRLLPPPFRVFPPAIDPPSCPGSRVASINSQSLLFLRLAPHSSSPTASSSSSTITSFLL